MNAKQRQQGIMLAVLVVVMITVYVWAFRRQGVVGQRPASDHGQTEPVLAVSSAPNTIAAPQPVQAPLNQVAQREDQHVRSMLLGWGRDPFTRLESRQATKLNLSGILWDAERPLAIINGQTLYVGEELEGYRVINISPDVVTITDNIKTYELRIAP